MRPLCRKEFVSASNRQIRKVLQTRTCQMDRTLEHEKQASINLMEDIYDSTSTVPTKANLTSKAREHNENWR